MRIFLRADEAVFEASAGHYITGNIEIHDVAGEGGVISLVVYIVGPCKIDRVVIPGNAEIRLLDLNGQVSAGQGVGAFRNLFRLIAVAGELFQHDRIFGCFGLIDDIIKGLPPVCILIRVQIQCHPQIFLASDNIGCTFGVEVQILVIACDLCTDQVVTTGGFLIAVPLIAHVVTVADVVGI